jgi:hypothetical protein
MDTSAAADVPFGKPVSTRRAKPKGVLFRDMLQSMQTAPTAPAIEPLRDSSNAHDAWRLGVKTSRYASFSKNERGISKDFVAFFAGLFWKRRL